VALSQDLRYSVRALARTPGFAVALVASAAIGIGANAVMFGYIGNLIDPAAVMPGVADDGWHRRLSTIRVLLTSVSIFVFVIAAASVIGLLLSRGAARVHETAVRVALGAQGRALYRPLLAEGAVVGSGAVALGLLIAFWTVQGLPAAFYAGDVEALPFVVDWSGLSIATVVGTLVIFGGALAPLAWTSRHKPAPDSRGTGPGLANTFGNWRSALVVMELSLCAVLLISTGAIVKRLDAALRTDHAVRTGDSIVARLRSVVRADLFVAPLLESVGDVRIELTHVLPGGLAAVVPYQLSEQSAGAAVELGTNVIGGANLDLIGLVLTMGRSFDARDRPRSRGVALVNEAAVPLLTGTGSPVLGRTLLDPDGRPSEVVGVVREIPFRTLQSRARPMIYLAYSQRFPSTLSLVIDRPESPPAGDLSAVVAASLASVRSDSITAVTTMQEHLSQTATAADRLVTGVVRVFAGLAVLLSLVGVVGVTSDAVARRTPEIALRMALGAPSWRIVAGVMMYGARLAVFGATVGVLLCLAGLRFVEPLADGTKGPQLVIWAAAPAVLVLMMVLGTLLPARRALAVDPARLLRE
jgi:ABC-type antimicrobial peptide transport system permease subunit